MPGAGLLVLLDALTGTVAGHVPVRRLSANPAAHDGATTMTPLTMT